MATNANQPAELTGQGGGARLIFPSHLAELINQDTGHPFVLLQNNEDDSEIALPVPDSITLADGANYEGLDRADFATADSSVTRGICKISPPLDSIEEKSVT